LFFIGLRLLFRPPPKPDKGHTRVGHGLQDNFAAKGAELSEKAFDQSAGKTVARLVRLITLKVIQSVPIAGKYPV
jgi:hypothetical protein